MAAVSNCARCWFSFTQRSASAARRTSGGRVRGVKDGPARFHDYEAPVGVVKEDTCNEWSVLVVLTPLWGVPEENALEMGEALLAKEKKVGSPWRLVFFKCSVLEIEELEIEELMHLITHESYTGSPLKEIAAPSPPRTTPCASSPANRRALGGLPGLFEFGALVNRDSGLTFNIGFSSRVRGDAHIGEVRGMRPSTITYVSRSVGRRRSVQAENRQHFYVAHLRQLVTALANAGALSSHPGIPVEKQHARRAASMTLRLSTPKIPRHNDQEDDLQVTCLLSDNLISKRPREDDTGSRKKRKRTTAPPPGGPIFEIEDEDNRSSALQLSASTSTATWKNIDIPWLSIQISEVVWLTARAPATTATKRLNSKTLQPKEGVPTVKNLYCVDYLGTHPNATEAESAIHGKNECTPKTKQDYQDKLRSQKQSAKVKQHNAAHEDTNEL
ncbi:hypothetical protein FPV67DRAFT_1447411 [Lyophyllum atratum]|nr:hypothetical protein FPV67DRAFT_1447411 [Lyophyllum atratum]